jgi:hypothetical protein
MLVLAALAAVDSGINYFQKCIFLNGF